MKTIQEIETERKQQRISKKMLYRRAQVSAETYRRIHKGISHPNTLTLQKLTDALASLRLGAAAE